MRHATLGWWTGGFAAGVGGFLKTRDGGGCEVEKSLHVLAVEVFHALGL